MIVDAIQVRIVQKTLLQAKHATKDGFHQRTRNMGKPLLPALSGNKIRQDDEGGLESIVVDLIRRQVNSQVRGLWMTSKVFQYFNMRSKGDGDGKWREDKKFHVTDQS